HKLRHEVGLGLRQHTHRPEAFGDLTLATFLKRAVALNRRPRRVEGIGFGPRKCHAAKKQKRRPSQAALSV
ncbi:MAG: hypothetical protein ACK56I_08065, partial [bacterium]